MARKQKLHQPNKFPLLRSRRVATRRPGRWVGGCTCRHCRTMVEA